MTDKLKPGMLRDLASMIEKHDPQDWPLFFREEAARREAEDGSATPHDTCGDECETPKTCGAEKRCLLQDQREAEQPAAPAPADDLVERLRDADPTFLLNEAAADRIEAQALEIARLNALIEALRARAEAAEAALAECRAVFERMDALNITKEEYIAQGPGRALKALREITAMIRALKKQEPRNG